jgi:hypothetical protein
MALNLQTIGSQPFSDAQASNLKPSSLPPNPCDKEKIQAFKAASPCHYILRFDCIGCFMNGTNVYNIATTMFGSVEANKDDTCYGHAIE